MSQDEIKAAIAQQEEYLKRIRSCSGHRFLAHRFHHGRCDRCGVTETDGGPPTDGPGPEGGGS